MFTAKFTAHYWVSHCEHSVGFDTVAEAYEFLRAGARAHSMAVDRITAADGTVVASREEVLGLDSCQASEDSGHPTRTARPADLD